jgi:hypothetical protein
MLFNTRVADIFLRHLHKKLQREYAGSSSSLPCQLHGAKEEEELSNEHTEA